MVDIWMASGIAASSSTGVAPLSWSEMSSFAQLNGITLKPYEASCLMDMSRAYANCVADINPLSIAPMERKYD